MGFKGHQWLDKIGPAAMTPLGRLGQRWNQTAANLPAGLTLSASSSLQGMRSLSRPSTDPYHNWTQKSGVCENVE